METLTFHIEDFDGPLDLLLYLVGKNKMNLCDVAILELIDQYVALIQTLQRDRLEVSSEFIEMAARLVQMKSQLLLPRNEEAERMRAELTGQLIEYEACKRVAAQLGTMVGRSFLAVRQPMIVLQDSTYEVRHDPALLERAWNGLMGRSVRRQPLDQERFEPLVTAPFVSVGSRVVHLLRGLVAGKFHSLGQLFAQRGSRSQNVATFLAVLELVRAGRLTIDLDETLAVDRSRAKRVKATSQEEVQWN